MIGPREVRAQLRCSRSSAYRHLRAAGGYHIGGRGILRVSASEWNAYRQRVHGRAPDGLPAALAPLAGVVQLAPELMPCIYFLVRDGEVVYVGQSIALGARLAQHRRRVEFDRAFFIPVAHVDLDETEAAFIRILRPAMNGLVPSATGPFGDEDTLRRVGFRLAKESVP